MSIGRHKQSDGKIPLVMAKHFNGKQRDYSIKDRIILCPLAEIGKVGKVKGIMREQTSSGEGYEEIFLVTISTLCIISWWFLLPLLNPSASLLGRVGMYGLMLFIVFMNVVIFARKDFGGGEWFGRSMYEYYLICGIGMTGLLLLFTLFEFISD